jgi:hypothetical protein
MRLDPVACAGRGCCTRFTDVKTILKLLIVVAIGHAAVRAGLVYWDHYQLEDQAQQLVLFGWRQTPDQLHDEILDFASRTGVPLESEDLLVERDGLLTTASAKYERPIEVLPSYFVTRQMSFDVEARNVTAVPTPAKKSR